MNAIVIISPPGKDLSDGQAWRIKQLESHSIPTVDACNYTQAKRTDWQGTVALDIQQLLEFLKLEFHSSPPVWYRRLTGRISDIEYPGTVETTGTLG